MARQISPRKHEIQMVSGSTLGQIPPSGSHAVTYYVTTDVTVAFGARLTSDSTSFLLLFQETSGKRFISGSSAADGAFESLYSWL